MKKEKGFLYVLSNPSIKGCKIGISRSHPDKRVKELSKPTGVPLPYELEYFALLPNYEFEEKKTHKHFAKFNIGKEQFDINPIDAFLYIKTLIPESEKIFPKLNKQLSEYHKEKPELKR